MFEPIATQKSLTLRTTIAPGCPPTLETDRQRFEQILRNLLSNALKFTEKGEVELLAAPAEEGFLSFTVRDTGIGIPPDQQKIIFDAFRQADGTVSRKYGGTGLGLSISRELARILGGRIELTSEPGNGSSFRLVVPTAFAAEVNTAQETARLPEIASPKPFDAMPFPREPARRPIVRSQGAIDDDRERLSLERRAILVVEDDRAFARILYELAREVGFDCLVAMSAEEAWDVAREFLPSAVILDVGLPDHSGLSVLDRLKHDRRTRHIPVHVVSASDYSLPALELGAVGHMLKPVKREELVAALNQIQNRLTQQTRRILLVEDDPLQLDSLARLLGSQQVETVGVRSASECLELLKTSTFDCMVLDLSLPDASGYSILETLSREDAYSFPPAIVYTGRDLSADEEQRLRRYSHSIIIKGAKSPERLLDEVTLFLHQVVAELPHEQQRMLEAAKTRDAAIEGRRILIVEDDVRNVFALTSMLEGRGAIVRIARNGREALEELERSQGDPARAISLILMDVMMPEMDGITATREIRSRPDWKKLPIIMLTAKAMKDDQEKCLAAGANDYMAKPLDVDKLLSLVRVWMPR
jgi:CheY-like chemotaxis protein